MFILENLLIMWWWIRLGPYQEYDKNSWITLLFCLKINTSFYERYNKICNNFQLKRAKSIQFNQS